MERVEHRTDEAPMIPESLLEELLEPLTSAVCFVLAEMANTDVFVLAHSRGSLTRVPGAVSAEVPLTSASLESLVVSFPEQTAAALASRMLPGVTEETDSRITPDCMGELANVIAGQAKALLAHTPFRFSFSVPRVLIESTADSASQGDEGPLVITFGSGLGNFTLELHPKLAK